MNSMTQEAPGLARFKAVFEARIDGNKAVYAVRELIDYYWLRGR